MKMSKIKTAKVIIFLCILIITKENIIMNPTCYQGGESPFVFSLDDYYYLYMEGSFTKINKETRETESSWFMEYLSPYIWMINQEKNIFLYIQNDNWYKVIEGTREPLSIDDDKYYDGGYIMETEYVRNNDVSHCICDIPKNEIILYRLNYENTINFYFKEQKKEISYRIKNSNSYQFDTKISCKLVSSGIYICALSANLVKIVLIRYYWIEDEYCEADIFADYDLMDDSLFHDHTSVEIFDLYNQNKKMICAINRETSVYECLFLKIIASVSCDTNECTYSADFEPTDFKMSFVMESADIVCELANFVFDNEGLFCCGVNFGIKCLRLIKENDEYSIKSTLDLHYTATKLFVFSDGANYIDIFYYNEARSNLYGYTIYKPTCININLTAIVYGESDAIFLNDDVFEEKMNTYYSIEFTNLPSTYGNLLINGEIKENPYEMDLNEYNILTFSSINDKTVENLEIKYSIIIYEGFSAECTITLNILPCWETCQKCTKSRSESNSENHNCVRDNCKANYYPSPITLTNCYTVEQKESNWYLDTQTNRFQLCNTNCSTCSGPIIDNCLTCYPASTKPELAYLYNNKCINECPEGTYPSIQTEGYYKCLPCYKNCETCSEKETYDDSNKLINMNCLKCKKESGTNNENQISIYSNCFPIKTYTDEKIIFDITELGTSETEKTCLDYNKAIIQGEYKCIEKEINYYYVLNNEENTGVIKKCDDACESCNGEKNQLTQDTNCINCYEGYFKTEDSNTNCILENLIPENYFKKNDNIYYKCYNNCKKCNNLFDAENNNMNCLECINDYYFVYDENNCYDLSFENENPYYFLEEDKKFHKCYFSCSRCSQSELDDNHHNCDKCASEFYFVFNTNNCYNDTILEQGYYLDNFTIGDNEKPTYKKCYELCKTCYNFLIENNMNCINCINGYHILNGTNNCYNETLLDKGYYLKDDMFFPCEENCKTCSDSKININDIISNNCLSCDELQNLFLVSDLKNCEPESFTENGYYIKLNEEDNTKIFYKCYESCSLCNEGEIDDIHNCLKCKDNYYPLKSDERNCYSEETIMEGYFLRENKWEKCYEKCATCNIEGNEEIMECLSCKTNYISREYNKLVYLKLKEGNCIIGCNDDLFLTRDIECVSSCPSGTYKYIPNYTCVDECPLNFIVNEEKTKCIFTSFQNETTSSNFKEIVLSDISNFVDESKIIRFSNFKAQILSTKDIDPIEQVKKGISGIDLGECIDTLKEKYNIPENEDLIMIQTEFKEDKASDDKNRINLGNTIKITITDINGNILNTSVCDNDINVLKYIGDTEEINMNTAEEFSEKGIDVFNATDDFFNDKCKYYDNDVDIIIKDRRDDIFQNVSFCGENCIYNGINYSLTTAVCTCNIISLEENNNAHPKDKNEKLNMNNLVNSFTEEIFSFNYDVIKCANLVINPKILKRNVGFYSNIAFYGLQISTLILFLLKKINPIKNFLKEYKSKVKNNPPKLFGKNNKNSSNMNLYKKLKIEKNLDNNNININKNENINNIDNDKNIDALDLNKNLNLNYKESESDIFNIINNKNKNIRKQEKRKTYVNNRKNIRTKKRNKTHVIKNNFNTIQKETIPTETIDIIKNDINKKKRISKIIASTETTNEIIEKNKNISVEKSAVNKNKNDKKKLDIDDKISCESIKYEKFSENKNEVSEKKNKIYFSTYEEYHDMEYDEAIKKDNRNFYQIYKSFIFEQHIILNTFFDEIYLELRSIKISFLFFGYSISFFLNAIFYTDEYISDTYHNNGVLNFASSLPKSIYSFIVTIILSYLLKMLSNSKKQLTNIINNKKDEQTYYQALEKEFIKLNIKLMVYFIIVFILGLFFAYYATAFCAVYRNSQMYWFYGCIESSILDIATPFIICLLLSGLRYISLIIKSKCIYKIANLMSNLF